MYDSALEQEKVNALMKQLSTVDDGCLRFFCVRTFEVMVDFASCFPSMTDVQLARIYSFACAELNRQLYLCIEDIAEVEPFRSMFRPHEREVEEDSDCSDDSDFAADTVSE